MSGGSAWRERRPSDWNERGRESRRCRDNWEALCCSAPRSADSETSSAKSLHDLLSPSPSRGSQRHHLRLWSQTSHTSGCHVHSSLSAIREVQSRGYTSCNNVNNKKIVTNIEAIALLE